MCWAWLRLKNRIPKDKPRRQTILPNLAFTVDGWYMIQFISGRELLSAANAQVGLYPVPELAPP
jgi:hypothetical protein